MLLNPQEDFAAVHPEEDQPEDQQDQRPLQDRGVECAEDLEDVRAGKQRGCGTFSGEMPIGGADRISQLSVCDYCFMTIEPLGRAA